MNSDRLLAMLHRARDEMIEKDVNGWPNAVMAAIEALSTPKVEAVAVHPLAKFGSGAEAKPGLYRVHWKSGGTSLASIGMGSNGDRWIAPTNFVRPARADAGEWGDIEHLTPIDPTITDEAVERAAKAIAQRQYQHSHKSGAWGGLSVFERAEFKGIARTALAAAFPSRGDTE